MLAQLMLRLAPKLSTLPDLEERLQRMVSEASATHPDVGLTPEAFVRHLAGRLAALDPARALDQLCAADLWLAAAACEGNSAAIRRVDEALTPLQRRIARIDPSADFIDEVLQSARQGLFVRGAGDGPGLGRYAGRAPLRRWLALVVSGVAIGLKRRTSADRRSDADALLGLLDPGVDPETAARWLDRAKTRLRDELRRRLAQRLKMATVEVVSLIRLLQSRLDLRLSEALAGEHRSRAED